MADDQAGSVFVAVIPDADRARFQEEIGKALSGVQAILSVGLKPPSKKDVKALVSETDAVLKASKDKPSLYVQLKIAKGEAKRAVDEANAHIKTLKNKPSLSIGLSVTALAARQAIIEANKRLKASKVETPRIKVQLDLDERQAKLVRELQVEVSKISATLPHIDIEVDLDEKSLNQIAKKAYAAYLAAQGRIDGVHSRRMELREIAEEQSAGRVSGKIIGEHSHLGKLIETQDAQLLSKRLSAEEGAGARISESATKSQNALNQKLSAGIDARSLEQIRQINRVALAQTRADLSKRTSSNVMLRQLRNDLGQFDASATRVLRGLTIGFGVFAAGVTVAFAGIAIASLKSFAATEQQLRRTAAVLGTGVYAQTIADLSEKGIIGIEAQTTAFAAFNKEVDATNERLAKTVNSVAIGTIFDPTEIASATRALAQAGLQVDQIKGSLLGVAQFAQNEQILPEEAVNSLVQGATAAGESLSSLTSLADKFTFVANNTTASAKEIADAFANRAAPQFKSLGQDIESTLTVLDLFAAAGIKGKTAGEQTGILIRFINQAAAKNTKVFQKYGIEVGKVNGQQVPFLRTLAQLSTLLDRVGKSGGSIKRTNLQAELGLTQKSAAGLNQILSQVTKGTGDNADEAIKKLFNLREQIKQSSGATQRQASVITKTLSFQFDILSNNITTLFKQSAGPLGRALTSVFRELNGDVTFVNGEVKQTGGLLDDMTKKFLKVGTTVAKFVAPAIKDFATGVQGKDFFGGIFASFKGVLTGLVDGFRAFRIAAFGEGSDKGFFTVMGNAFAGLGRFAATALPAIGKTLGTIVGFIRENKDEVKLFLKAWFGLLIVSKALRLFLIPLVSVTENLGFLKLGVQQLAATSLGSTIIGWTKALVGYRAGLVAAAAAEKAAAAARAVAAGASGFSKVGLTADAIAAGANARTARAAAPNTKAIAKSATRGVKGIAGTIATVATTALTSIPGLFTKLLKPAEALKGGLKFLPTIFKSLGVVLKGVARFAGPVGLIVLAIEAVIGAVKGFGQGFKEQFSTKGEAAKGLKSLLSVFKVVGRVILDVLSVVGSLGASIGRLLGRFIGNALTQIGNVISGIKKLFQPGNFKEGLAQIGKAILDGFTKPFRFIASFIIDIVADLLHSLRNIPAIGDAAESASKKLRGVAASVAGAQKADVDASVAREAAAKAAKKANDAATASFKLMAAEIDGNLFLSKRLQTTLSGGQVPITLAIRQSALAYNGLTAGQRIAFDQQRSLNALGFVDASKIENVRLAKVAIGELGTEISTKATVAVTTLRSTIQTAAQAGIDRFRVLTTTAKNLGPTLTELGVPVNNFSGRFLATFAQLTGAAGAVVTATHGIGPALSDLQNPIQHAKLGFIISFNTMERVSVGAARAAQNAFVGTEAQLNATNNAIIQATASLQAGMQLSIEAQGNLQALQTLANSPDANVAKAGRALLEGERLAALVENAKKAKADSAIIAKALGDDITVGNTPAADKKAEATKAVKTAAELATAAVEKLNSAQFKGVSDALIAKISKVGIKYKANALDAAVLAKAIPLVDAALTKQTDLVTKLDAALQSLQSTQLAGTKAANDAAFGFTQQQNALELQKVNLQLGTPGIQQDDPAIKAIDDQLANLALQAQKASLESSIALDPLKKKLEETFTPVKELGFDAIIAQFQKLSTAKTAAEGNVTKTTELKAKLDAVAAVAADKFSGIGLNVTQGIEKGLASGNAALVDSSKKAANTVSGTVKNALGIASPSRVFAQIGVDTMTGFNNGMLGQRPTLVTTAIALATDVRRIFAADQFYIAAGAKVMRGFKAGLNNEYAGTSGVQAFVKEIAVWIKDNKGPISYDAQLLRPAGEAMMSGFHGGLRDGFGEIKGWVKNVAPSLANDTFPKDLFIKRSARFLINNAKTDLAFNPQDAFGDLLPTDFFAAGGAFDPSLNFLHKTLSIADTTEMAKKLISGRGLNLASVDRAAGTLTSSGKVSDHTFGTAADLGTGGARPTAASLALFEKLKPLLGTVFKQLIHNGVGLTAGGGTFADSEHYDHIHAAWLKGPGFDKLSGKKGVGALAIPGVPADVLNAIGVASQAYKFDPTIIAAVMKQESGFRKNVVSGDGGYGLMQLTSANLIADADRIGGRLNPVANALVGTKYLSDLVNQLGSLNLGLSAYNSGPGGGERQGHIDVPAYVASVLRYLAEIRRQAGIGGRRAQGGQTNPNTTYMVGERGRELFVPDQRGSIITNKNVEALIAAMQTGATMVQPGAQQPVWAPQFNVTSNSADPATIVALLEARMRAEVKGIRR